MTANKGKNIKFERIVVFGDLHGDLDIMLASLSEKGLVRYDRDLDSAIKLITECVNESFAPTLEAMVIPQKTPVRVIFMGDFLDRYHFGYHIIQFLDKIRWENFRIYPIFLMGNHDLLNFHFFVNPFEVSEIYQGCGHSKDETVSYITSMGVDKSLESFKALHADEIVNRQIQFYKTGALEYQEDGYSLRYQYPCDLSSLAEIRFTGKDYTSCYNQIVTKLGFAQEKLLENDSLRRSEELGFVLPKLFGKFIATKKEMAQRNWWSLSYDPKARHDGYSSEISNFNLFIKKVDEDNNEIIPVDWRIISLVWRHHYGNFFRRTRLLHHESTTVFAHGGISPLAMVDPFVFGSLYDPRSEKFKSLKSKYESDLSLEKVINRSNRLMAQILENALNDYSFRRMNGAEIVDQIGFWRGSTRGFPIFGGPIWSDFEYLHSCVKKDERLLQLYKNFKEATGIERIICGHTHFMDKPEIRFQGMSELKALGLEYLCVDNSCSRAYRMEPVLNGIEIDPDGNILGQGSFFSSPW
ncbi:MAG: metallophosphoesterase [Pseudomonadota bacterium]